MRTSYEKVQQILALKAKGISSRKIAQKVLGSASKKSTVNDILARETKGMALETKEVHSPEEVNTILPTPPPLGKSPDVVNILTTNKAEDDCTHLMIPDTQVKDGIDMAYLRWVGEYIAHKQPDVLIHIGDHADMPSLSSYDKGKKAAEGRRVQTDINAAIEGMNILLGPLYELQQQQLKQHGRVYYRPKMVLTLGNHEERIMRHVDANPELEGFLSYDNLKYKEMGWEVYDYLEPVIINGVTYCHFMPNPMSGKPWGGSAQNILKNVGESFCMGHKQTLDVATRFLPSSGKQQWAIICGACYKHDESYKGYQGNKHYRGLVVMHNTKHGSFDPMFVSLDYLESRYG